MSQTAAKEVSHPLWGSKNQVRLNAVNVNKVHVNRDKTSQDNPAIIVCRALNHKIKELISISNIHSGHSVAGILWFQVRITL